MEEGAVVTELSVLGEGVIVEEGEVLVGEARPEEGSGA